MKSECPFVVGEWYQLRVHPEPAKFVAYVPEAKAGGRAVFLYDGIIVSRYVDGRVYSDGKHGTDILPPAPKLVERWVAVYRYGGKLYADGGLYESEKEARKSSAVIGVHKIEVPE